MKVSEDVVKEVRQAEAQANTAAIIERASANTAPSDDGVYPKTYLSQEATVLLVEAADAKNGTILNLQTLGGQMIQANGKRFGDRGDRRSMA
jgi:hypothetical protein